MADTTPRLHSAPVDPQTNYAPLSWMAAAAFGVAALFALVLIFLAYFAFRERKPIIEPWLFVFPILGIVLAFAARRHIRNSEGTRTGMEWASIAWWICVVGGLSYFAYLRATEFTISSDTDKQFAAWSDNLKKSDPNAANDLALSAAFYQTLPPAQRGAFTANNTTEMQNRFGPDMVTFRQNKLLMMLQRNPDRAEIVAGGLQQYQQTPGKIECSLSALLKTPEGEFPIVIPMVATVTNGKREWQISAFDGYVQDSPGTLRTPYGWLVQWLEGTARASAEQFIATLSARTLQDGFPVAVPEGILAQPVAHDVFGTHKLTKPIGDRIVFSAMERAKITGALGLFWPTSPEYARDLRGPLFVQIPMPDGKMLPDAGRGDFLHCWDNAGFDTIAMAGRNIVTTTDKNALIRFFPDRVEASIPIELKVPKSDPKGSAALGRLVLTLDDPAALAELSEARELGLKGEKTATPKDFQKPSPKWKVARIESNLKVIRAPAGPGGGPGGPGGGPPGGQ